MGWGEGGLRQPSSPPRKTTHHHPATPAHLRARQALPLRGHPVLELAHLAAWAGEGGGGVMRQAVMRWQGGGSTRALDPPPDSHPRSTPTPPDLGGEQGGGERGGGERGGREGGGGGGEGRPPRKIEVESLHPRRAPVVIQESQVRSLPRSI